MIPQTVDRIARTVQSSARSGAAVADIFRESMRHIVAKVPLDGWCGLTLDPATLLMTGGVHEHGLQPTAIRRLLEIEYGESDVNLFSDLARAKLPAGSLWDATAGRPEQSARYRDVLRPNGYEGELRAVLRAGGCSWGALVLLRRIGRPAFNADQLALLAALSEPIAKAIRLCFITGTTSAMESLRDHALVVIGPSNRVESTTPAAERWLEELAELGPPDPARLPHTVQAIANEARRLAKSEENSGQSQSRARTRHGEWVTLHASIVGEGADQRVIVFIEPSGPWEVASLILRAYGLTRREGELVRLVLHGFDTEQAADILNISPYTVQDHLKSIFAKIGVGSRKELVARLFFTHYLPRIQSGLFLGPDGWFVERNDQLVVGPESRARLGSQR